MNVSIKVHARCISPTRLPLYGAKGPGSLDGENKQMTEGHVPLGEEMADQEGWRNGTSSTSALISEPIRIGFRLAMLDRVRQASRVPSKQFGKEDCSCWNLSSGLGRGEEESYLGTAIDAWKDRYLVDTQIPSKGFCRAILGSKPDPRPASLEFKTEVGESLPLSLLLGVWCTRGEGRAIQPRQGSSADERIKCLQGSQIVVDGKGHAANAPGPLLSSSSPSFLVTLSQAFGMPAQVEGRRCPGKRKSAYRCQP